MTIAEIQRRLGIGAAAAMRVQLALGGSEPALVDPSPQECDGCVRGLMTYRKGPNADKTRWHRVGAREVLCSTPFEAWERDTVSRELHANTIRGVEGLFTPEEWETASAEMAESGNSSWVGVVSIALQSIREAARVDPSPLTTDKNLGVLLELDGPQPAPIRVAAFLRHYASMIRKNERWDIPETMASAYESAALTLERYDRERAALVESAPQSHTVAQSSSAVAPWVGTYAWQPRVELATRQPPPSREGFSARYADPDQAISALRAELDSTRGAIKELKAKQQSALVEPSPLAQLSENKDDQSRVEKGVNRHGLDLPQPPTE